MMNDYADINWAIDQMKDDLRLAYRADDPSGHLARLERNAELILKWIEFKNTGPEEETDQ